MTYYFIIAYQLKDPTTDESALVTAIKSGNAWAQMNDGTYIVETMHKSALDVMTPLREIINQSVDSLSVISVVRHLSAVCDDRVARLLGSLPHGTQ
jgi:hypothetical protein